ncbi:MAG TPA: XdhC family protein [Steroidobacteraceae bacterium]|jgi:xanthine/CO dehydrogenase XdhC/CoxF family maturation factor
MDSLLDPLLPLFARERAANNAVALGVLVQTIGSTYRKAGAMMLFSAEGDFAGLLSGGCLESDLREHVRGVIETGEARLIDYDTRGGDDAIWGLGLGCEGAIRILLTRVGPEKNWEPLSHLAECLARHRRTAVAVVVESASPASPVGTAVLAGDPAFSAAAATLQTVADSGQVAWYESDEPRCRLFVFPLILPPRLLLLGAGPDAYPLVDFAARLGWKVTLADHRPAYADPSHFPAAEAVVLARPEELGQRLDLSAYAAAVAMSHHLPSDLAYLRVLAGTSIPYIGLLGPAARRERLLCELGPDAAGVRARLRSPVGLAIGGRTPESVALSIVSEIHAFMHAAEGGTPTTREPPPASGKARPVPA